MEFHKCEHVGDIVLLRINIATGKKYREGKYHVELANKLGNKPLLFVQIGTIILYLHVILIYHVILICYTYMF